MIAQFPTPFADELLASACARLISRFNPPSRRAIVESLFGPNAVVVFDFPSRLDHFVACLPLMHGLKSDTLIQRHTLLPLYAPFLPRERLDRVVATMCGNKGNSVHMLMGVMASRMPTPQWLRLCPGCLSHDLKQCGEVYWHRVHQLTGLTVCPVHGCALIESDVARTNRINRHQWECPPEKISRSTPVLPTFSRVLRDLAEDALWLLNNCHHQPGPEKLLGIYVALLRKKGLASHAGRLQMKEIYRQFADRFVPELLDHLYCAINPDTQADWLGKILRSAHIVQAPLRHLLLIHFLGYRAEKFFSDIAASRLWVELETSIPALCSRTRLKKDVDSASLETYWNDRSLSLRAIARHFHLDPHTVKRKAVECGLHFPRRAGRTTHRSIDREKCSRPRLANDRKTWKRLQIRYPQRSASELRGRHPTLFARLYRQDRIWLQNNQPAPKQVSRVQRADWQSRDRFFSRQVTRAAQLLLRQGNRLTRYTISQSLGIGGVMYKYPAKLPRTVTAILLCVERHRMKIGASSGTR
jgi:hypothetical protein